MGQETTGKSESCGLEQRCPSRVEPTTGAGSRMEKSSARRLMLFYLCKNVAEHTESGDVPPQLLAAA